jgi:hypothetical protein
LEHVLAEGHAAGEQAAEGANGVPNGSADIVVRACRVGDVVEEEGSVNILQRGFGWSGCGLGWQGGGDHVWVPNGNIDYREEGV